MKISKSISEFQQQRSAANDKILNSGFNDYKKFFALDHKAYLSGALPAKMKELMGLTASMVLRCNDCILYHLQRCVEEGASRDELHEAMNIALIVGGSIVIPHLRYAFKMLDELAPAKKSE